MFRRVFDSRATSGSKLVHRIGLGGVFNADLDRVEFVKMRGPFVSRPFGFVRNATFVNYNANRQKDKGYAEMAVSIYRSSQPGPSPASSKDESGFDIVVCRSSCSMQSSLSF